MKIEKVSILSENDIDPLWDGVSDSDDFLNNPEDLQETMNKDIVLKINEVSKYGTD